MEAFDLIVIGGGGSGLAAAAEGAARGARVLLVEAAEALGGSTAWSIGSFTSSGTPHQKAAGVDDSPEQHFADMDMVNAEAKRPDNRVLRRILTYGSPDTFRWLMDMGVEFIGPNPETPHTRPRMHNVIPGASSYIYHLEKRCRKLGVDIRCSTGLTDLIFEQGRVTGAEVQGPDGRRVKIGARRGVILASGDYSASKELRGRYFKPEVVAAEPVNKNAKGEVFKIAERYGAKIVNGDFGGHYIPKMRFVPPAKKNLLLRLPPNRLVARVMKFGFRWVPAALARPFLMRFITTALGPELNLFRNGAALVNSEGRAIDVDLKSIAKDLALDPTNKGFIIFDQKTAELFETWPNFVSTAPNVAYAYIRDYRAARKDVFHKGDTLDDLARSLGVSADSLTAAMKQHNETPGRLGRAQDQGPFYALGPVRAYITTTNGGLDVNEKLQVLNATEQPIEGLYAAGSAGQGGQILGGHGHHIGWAFVSGRHAAKVALGQN